MTDIQVRRGTSTQWSTMNPVLLAGELGWDTTLKRFKMGDGLTGWNTLEFFLDIELNLKAPLNSPAFTGTVSGITKAMVGLGSVDNTADTAKPVSTAQQTALNGKANTSHTHSAADMTSGTLPDARLPARLGTISQTVTDFNLAITNGNYMGFNIPNSPTTGTWYIADVVAHNALYVTQTAHGFTTDGSTNTAAYRRSSTDSGGSISWGAWYKLQLSQAEQDLRYQALIAAGTTAQYYRGDKTWQTLNAAAVGLGSVNNTADTAKPVSTAQQTALDLKADLVSPTFTGTVGGITKAMVGLTNVDDTADTAKPVSTAQQTALDLKADLASPTFTGTVGGITKAMVGLTNVDDTTDAAKPVSTAQQTALNLKANLASPTFTGTVSGVTKAMVGLGSVDNTADTAKPVSTAQQTALNLKANLASPTFTGTVSGITKAMVGLGSADNTADTAKPVSTAQQTALNLKANLASPTFTGTVSGITKSMVGLSSVDNTADTAKPVSTAQQTALNLKANLASPTFTGTVSGISKGMVGLANVDNTADADKPVSFPIALALVEKIDVSEKASVNGVASLGSDGRVPAAQLPAVAGGAVISMQGTYSSGRPAASAVSIGTVYYATDVYEQYRSDGTDWSVVGNGGNERGSATITALQSTTNGVAGPVDIVGMTTTFVAGERPVRIVLDCDMTNSSATNITTVQILLNDVQIFIVNSTASNSTYIWQSFSKGIRKAGLTPGGIYTARARLYVTGGTGFIGGATDNPSTLSVISL